MSLTLGVLVAILIVIIGSLVFRQTGNKPSAELDDSSLMPAGLRRTLASYLILLGVLLVYMLVALYSVDLPEVTLLPVETPSAAAITGQNSPPTPPVQNQPGSGQTPNQTVVSQVDDKAAPVIVQVFPETTIGPTPRIWLAIYGSRFTQVSKARLNGVERPIAFGDEHMVRVALESADLVGVGAVIVDIKNADGKLSNGLGVPIARPTAILNVFGVYLPITKETQLILLAIFAGMLGSYVHALQSLADFVGNRTLMTSWFWWYVTRPFLGMAMALIFYAVIRGGFLAGTPADAKVVNPFGVVAVGTLVGMFSDKAAQKLSEVFDTLFKSDDKRSGKLAAPVIDTLEPDTALVGAAPPVLTVKGDHLAETVAVRVNGEQRPPESVAGKEVRIKLKPEDVARPSTLKITLIDPNDSASTSATLHVSDLAITTSTVAQASVGSDYTQAMVATGGSAPYKWRLVDAPQSLRIEENTGILRGKFMSAGKIKLTTKITDALGASASRSFDLEVV